MICKFCMILRILCFSCRCDYLVLAVYFVHTGRCCRRRRRFRGSSYTYYSNNRSITLIWASLILRSLKLMKRIVTLFWVLVLMLAGLCYPIFGMFNFSAFSKSPNIGIMNIKCKVVLRIYNFYLNALSFWFLTPCPEVILATL